MHDINEVTDDISMPKANATRTARQYFDPAADYTERTGRHLSLSERMQERSLRDQRNEF